MSTAPGHLLSRLIALVSASALGLVLAAGLLFALTPQPARANGPFVVTNLNTLGPGSLGQAILDANAAPGLDTLSFAPGLSGTIVLTTALPAISQNVVISGPGPDILAISGANTFRVLSTTLYVDLAVSGLTLRDGNAGALDGGAIAASAAVTLTNVNVLSNTAGYGGGVYASEAWIEASRFQDNSATSADIYSGGGGLLLLFGPLHISATEFISNTTAGDGGGVFAVDLTPAGIQILNSRFEGNSAGRFSGGLYSYYTATITSCEFLSNTALYGAGFTIVATESVGSLMDSLFQGNRALEDGGGASSVYGRLVVTWTRFVDNTAAAGCCGGAFALRGLSVRESEFVDNRAETVCGGVCSGGPLGVANSLFVRNSASSGSAIDLGREPASILHTTIIGSGREPGAAITALYDDSVTITNSIIANYAVGLEGSTLFPDAVHEDYNLFFGNGVNFSGTVSGGGHSVFGDPLFVDPAAGDYRLRPGSPAADAAWPAGLAADLDGNPRPYGAGYDIGAYELSNSEIPIAGLTAENSGPTRLGQTTLFSASVTGGSNVLYVWDFGDHSPGVNGNSAAHTYASAGSFTAIVTATNSAGTFSATTPVTITNLPPIANAGSDQAVFVGSPVMLAGTGSNDPDGHWPLAYSWSQAEGPAVTLFSALTSAPTFTAPSIPSTLVFAAVVTDSAGLSAIAPDSVRVTVSDVPIAGLSAARSGPTPPGMTAAFTATVEAGSNVVYQWSFGDGVEAEGATAAHAYSAAGTYTATLSATNGAGSVGVTLAPLTFPPQQVYLPLVRR